MTRKLQIGLCVTILLHLVWAQTNCSRAFHSAVLNNDTVWVSGGDMHVAWPNHSITSYSIRDLQTIDLSKSWSNSDDDLFTHIPRPWNDTNTAEYAPWLDEGDSWSDGESLYFYGGYTSGWEGPPVPPLATWRYDIKENTWTRNGFSGSPLVRLCEGGAVQSNIHKKAYYLSGALHPNGNPTFAGTEGAETYMDTGLISLDMTTQVWSNYSTTGMNNWGTIGDGYTGIIETAGDEGLIVAFGGYTYPLGEAMSILAGRQRDWSRRNSMEHVRVYDIANRIWYTQKTSGDIPRWRMSGCTVTVSAPDLSSYSIYIFGGMSSTTDDSDGNVYVLSIPSFRWIKVYSGDTLRIKHQCLLVQNHTMLTIGGMTPITDQEYIPVYSNCDSTTFANGIGIFDLTTLSWQTNYNASDNKQYIIPSKISAIIGGSENGKATLNSPEGGFNSTSMESLFKTGGSPLSNNTAVPVHSSKDSDQKVLSVGQIAGAVTGSVLGAAFVVGLAIILIGKRRQNIAKKQRNPEIQSQKQPLFEVHSNEPVSELAGLGPNGHAAEMPTHSSRWELPSDTNRQNGTHSSRQ